jgi:hypothetical protein
MFCPSCKAQIPDNLAFCPGCGGKLPKVEKMQGNPDKMNLQQASAAAQSGFDTGKPLATQGGGNVPQVGPTKATQPASYPIGIIITGIVVALVIFFTMMGGGSGKVRNCIRSALGSPPECSDCENTYRSTTMNGKYYGNCRALPGNYNYDDQCNLGCK